MPTEATIALVTPAELLAAQSAAAACAAEEIPACVDATEAFLKDAGVNSAPRPHRQVRLRPAGRGPREA